jgi:hypothetical protein
MSKMKKHMQPNKSANGIADSIVELVERTDGPVTLTRIDREISAFEKKEPPAWSMLDCSGRLIWDGMTEAGLKALHKVIHDRKVAIQLVNALPYILENCVLENEDWCPIVLLPAKAANLKTPTLLIRASQGYREYCVTRAAAEGKTGHQLLTPSPLRCTADQFSV